ncbi:MAG: chromate transporter, partial [Solirubrobacterales bacterium]|nr:chromate transporter [Solirubrobacterales bacterium]
LKLVRASITGAGEGPLDPQQTVRRVVYLTAGAAATVALGPAVVLVLLLAGLMELALRRGPGGSETGAAAGPGLATLPALVWTAFKVGALSYGGGFVIIPLMQADAVEVNGWLSQAEFLNAVALGQITPGPVVQTVAAVGYGAAGIPGGALAALVAFAPSFALVIGLAPRFARLRDNPSARAFLDGAGPAAVGAILGAAVVLLDGVREPWQVAVLVVAGLALLSRRAGGVLVLLVAALLGVVVALAGGPLPAA